MRVYAAPKLIVGNPPFGQAKNKLWTRISLMMIKLLAKGGTIIYITPPSFLYLPVDLLSKGGFKITNNVEMMEYISTRKNFIYYDLVEYFVEFVRTSICCWCVIDKQNDEGKGYNFIDEYGEIFSKIFVNPKHGKLLGKADSLSRNRNFSPTQSEQYPYKVMNGIKVLYSDAYTADYNRWKVLCSRTSRYFIPCRNVSDIDGIYYLMPDRETAIGIAMAWNSKIIQAMVEAGRIGMARPQWLIRALPNFDEDTIRRINEIYASNGSSDNKKARANAVVRDSLGVTKEDEDKLMEAFMARHPGRKLEKSVHNFDKMIEDAV